MGTTIFYFSGTGNSLMLARDIAAELGDARLISIPKAIREPELDLSDDEYIGFVYPVYFMSNPLIVRDFIRKFASARPLDNKKFLFAVVNCGNTPGNALNDLAQLIREQGAELAAGFHLKLPENYIIALKPPGALQQEKQFQQEKLKVKAIVAIIKAQRRTGIEKAPFAPLIRSLLPVYKRLTGTATESQQTATIQSSARSFRVESSFPAESAFPMESRCKGCGICRSVCPVNNIEIKNGKPQWRDKCQQCLACINWCPERAIQFGKKTIQRERYTNPTVTVKDMIDSAGNEVMRRARLTYKAGL